MSAALATFLSFSHIPILLVVGFAIFAGTVGARLFQRLRIPQVVGYIVIGLLIGRSGFGFIDAEAIKSLEPFNSFALGVIGFMIGGELRRDVLRKHGRQFFKILLAEGMGAFLVVGLLVGATALLLTDAMTAVALGLMFGALSSATAPAATVNVLWEYKTRGPLTRAIYAIVALDDALALILFVVCVSLVTRLMGQAPGGALTAAAQVAWELAGAVALGAATGGALNFALRRARDAEKAFPFILSMVLLTIGIAALLKLDGILAAMALGVTLANLAPRRSKSAFEAVRRFAPPVYVLFFVLVGAHLHLQTMPAWMWALTLPYVVGRSAGKMLGANFGARRARAAKTVQKYLGMSLFCQAGVAVGLSLVASQRFSGEIGSAIIMIIAVTTLIVELIGPPFVKLAVQRAGEVGLNVTKEELMASYTVGEAMDRDSPSFLEAVTLPEITRTIAETDAMHYPVVDAAGGLTGVIALQELKNGLAARGLADWLVASDLMGPVPDTVSQGSPLAEAVIKMREQGLDYLPVVAGDGDAKLVGMLELRAVDRMLSSEVLRRQQLADAQLA